MAVSNADRDALVNTLFAAFGEDYVGMGRLLAALETNFPAIAWRTRLGALAPSYAKYLSSGLSIAWFTAEVGRYADSFK